MGNPDIWTELGEPTTFGSGRRTRELRTRFKGLLRGRGWKVASGAAAAGGGLILAWICGFVAPAGWAWLGSIIGGVVGALAGASVSVALYMLMRQSDEVQELRALVNVRPLSGDLPVDLTHWAVDPVLAELVLRRIVTQSPGLIVECGSGWSTMLIAKCLSHWGEGRIVAFEHLEEFVDRTRKMLCRFGGNDVAQIVHAPLVDRSLDGETWPWYGGQVENALDGEIDLLLVNGPPGELAAQSRYPAGPILGPSMAHDGCIILDDGYRSQETNIARRWSERLGGSLSFVDSRQGVWVLDLGGNEARRSCSNRIVEEERDP